MGLIYFRCGLALVGGRERRAITLGNYYNSTEN